MSLYRNKYRIESSRLQHWDYGSPGLYFITICTKNREHFFGEIGATKSPSLENGTQTQDIASPPLEMQDNAVLQATTIGAIAQHYWEYIPKHFPFVELDEWIVMPNHVHGIILLKDPKNIETADDVITQEISYQRSVQRNKFGPQSKNLASIIRGYKAGVKTFATINQIEFAWQPRYHDRIIRTERELNNVRKYIINNPMKWEQDRNNAEDLMM